MYDDDTFMLRSKMELPHVEKDFLQPYVELRTFLDSDSPNTLCHADSSRNIAIDNQATCARRRVSSRESGSDIINLSEKGINAKKRKV